MPGCSMASPSQFGRHCGEGNHAQGALEDLQDILADTLEDARFYESKQHMGSRVADLMKAKTALLSSAAEARLQNVEKEYSDRLQDLRLEVAERECQLVSARADTDQWKRRAGVLFLKMSSIQEDVDMYSMRCRLLEAEISRESKRTQSFKSNTGSLQQRLTICQEQLQESQHAAQALQEELNTAHQNVEKLEKQVYSLKAELVDCKQAAAAHAASAAKKLAEAQAKHESAMAQAASAGKAAEAAEKRCEELQWRLQQQDEVLAQRTKLVQEARAATEGLSKEGIQAVREKASFLEKELREQLADTRSFLEEERRQRRAAEASLAQQLAQVQMDASALRSRLVNAEGARKQHEADASALRARLATAEDAQKQHEARQALDVVSSLVEDLASPDSLSRPNRLNDAVHSGSREKEVQQDMPAAEAKAWGTAALSAADKAAKGGIKMRVKAAKDASATARVSVDKAATAAAKLGQKDADRAPEEDRAARGGAETKGKTEKGASGIVRAPAGKTATTTAQASQQGADGTLEAGKAAKIGAGARKNRAKRPSDADIAPGDEPRVAEAKKQGVAKAWDADALPAEDAAAGSPEQGGAAGRPSRRRASKAPWWMGQATNPAGNGTADLQEEQADPSTVKPAAKQKMHAESDYEPTAIKKAHARKHLTCPAPLEMANEAGSPEGEQKPSAANAEMGRGKKRRSAVEEAAVDDAGPKAPEPVRKRARDKTDKASSQLEEALAAEKPCKKAKASAKGSAAAGSQPEDMKLAAAEAKVAEIKKANKTTAAHASEPAAMTNDAPETEEGNAPVEVPGAMQTDTGDNDAADVIEPAEPRAARRKTRAPQQQSQAGVTVENADASAGGEADQPAGKMDAGQPVFISRPAPAQQAAQISCASSQTNAASEDTSAAANKPSGQGSLLDQTAKPRIGDMQVAQAGIAKQIAKWDKARPAGVSKLDLTTVWGHTPTPLATLDDQGAGDEGAKEKENPAQPAAKAPSLAGVIKPVPGRSRFNTAMEANPLAALNPRVLEAAGALRPSYVSGLAGPNRLSYGGQAQAGKRKLLSAPKPMGAVGALSQEVLFGQGFKVPRLGRQ